MLNIQARQVKNSTILDLEGDMIMGGGSAKFRETLAELIKDEKTSVLINFQKVIRRILMSTHPSIIPALRN